MNRHQLFVPLMIKSLSILALLIITHLAYHPLQVNYIIECLQH